MIKLSNKDTNTFIGTINEEQLQFLIDQLEEESSEDKDYYINSDTLEVFEARGIDQELLALLKNELGSREGIEIEWEHSEE